MEQPKCVSKNNVNRIVRELSAHGLTEEKFAASLRLYPHLLEHLGAERFLENFRGVAEVFEENGLSANYYLGIALRQPSLFCQDAAGLKSRVDQLAAFVTPYRFPVKAFLSAAQRRPTLLTREPEILSRNLRAVVDAFATDGLTKHDYLRAVLKCPNILSSPPVSIIRNIRGAVTMLEEHGELITADYIDAALRNPNLFYAKPDTVLRKYKALRAFQDRRLVAADPPVLAAVLDNPQHLFWSDAHIALRRLYVRVTGETGIPFRTLFSKPRPTIEREIIGLCGLDPDEQVVSPQALAGDAGGIYRYRKRRVRRALGCGVFEYYELAA